ncbi:YceI family protein [Undibacterium sp. CY7W]|uniref:YceI family protein n=2 Tax=Undibacterium rugosum TaxID=2762291 RepID=A0A923I1G7_9BURK|nr:YceI family protein [Undibacterium rugosum]MBC3935926.1 YceI family protein [Undibacterium rugosum]
MKHLPYLSRRTRWAASMAALVLAIPAFAAVLKVDTSKSQVNIVFKQMNVPVDAKFKKFSANIDYNAAKPESSKANVEIELNSFDLGDAEYNKEVLKKEWFNAAQFPKASFTSTAMKAAGAGKLDVSGTLAIKGKTSNVSFPVTIKQEGGKQVFDGALPIKRLTYNIGEGEWKDTSMVADEVTIKFHVVTQP